MPSPRSQSSLPTRRRAGWTIALISALVWVGAGLASGCRGDNQRDSAAQVVIEPVGETEAELALSACRDYVQAVCECAQAKPDDAPLQEQCQLAGAKVSGVEMLLQLNRTTGADDERVKSENTLRRYTRACIEDKNALAKRGCPR